MFSIVFRKIYNFILIPFALKNWITIIFKYFFVIVSGKRDTIALVTLRTGQKFKVRLVNTLDLGSIMEIFIRKVYMPSGLFLLPENPIIIDIGASIGDFTIYCASFYKDAEVYSYECNEDALELFIENVKINSLDGKIHISPLAISHDGQSISLDDKNYKAITLLDIFKMNSIFHCDLLKIDIEGAEYDILLDVNIDELKKRIKNLTMECHFLNNQQKEDFDKLKSRLNNAGFTVTTTEVNVHDICYLYAVGQ